MARKTLTKAEKKVLVKIWVKGKYEKAAKKDAAEIQAKYSQLN